MALWTPALSDTALWLDAADVSSLTLDGSSVSVWSDLSGSDHHLTMSGSARPEVSFETLDEKNEVVFNGTSQYLQFAGALDFGEAVSIFEVFRRPSSGIHSFGFGANGGRYGPWWFSDNVSYSAVGSTGYAVHGGASAETGVFLSSFVRAGTACELWINGAARGGPQSVGGSGSALFSFIGKADSYFNSGRKAEIVVVPFSLAPADRARIEGYLAHKWGLASNLPSDHPYKTDAPQALAFTGTVRDKTGALAARTVTALRESDQTVVGTTTSDATTGEFEIVTLHDEAHALIFSGEADRNALVYRGVMPE